MKTAACSLVVTLLCLDLTKRSGEDARSLNLSTLTIAFSKYTCFPLHHCCTHQRKTLNLPSWLSDFHDSGNV